MTRSSSRRGKERRSFCAFFVWIKVRRPDGGRCGGERERRPACVAVRHWQGVTGSSVVVWSILCLGCTMELEFFVVKFLVQHT